MKRLFDVLRRYGIIWCLVKICNKISYKIFKFFNDIDIKFAQKAEAKKQEANKKDYDYLNKLIKNKKFKYVFVFYPYVEWNLPIFQRPHQIALELTKRNDVLYLFCTANCHYDNIEGVYQKIKDNLYVITDFNYVSNLDINNRIIHLYSTDTVSKYNIVEEALNRKDKVLYEYIDEIHEEITHSLPTYYLQKHNKILKNEHCYVIATADKLLNDVKKVRNKNFALSTNGVTIEDFIRNDLDEVPEEIVKIKENYKKVICYYGSLASWFDYDLIKKIARKFSKYAIVLIGLEYDDSFKKSRINNLKNVFYLGKKDYKDLHKYSENSDLLIIPFLINEITESTSPVKLFEYMATRIPILTTDMKECRKYKSVMIGKNHDDFIAKIDSTMNLINDKDYLDLEMKEALENTWEEKADIILKLLNKK